MTVRMLSATIPGYEHTKPGKPVWRNNQDNYAVWQRGDKFVMVVSDGCGSTEHSEIGSFVIANHMVDYLSRAILEIGVRQICMDECFRHTTNVLYHTINKIIGIAETYGDIKTIITKHAECSLATCVFIIGDERDVIGCVFGDGVLIFDDMLLTFEYPGNAPPYIAYDYLLPRDQRADQTFQVFRYARCDLHYGCAVGSDGVLDAIRASKIVNDTDLQSFLRRESSYDNPDSLRRYLAKLNRESVKDGRIVAGHLPDDTTLCAARFS